MIASEVSNAALELSAEDRLELARRLVESVVEPVALKQGFTEAVRRIEDIVAGRVQGLTEEQYRAALE